MAIIGAILFAASCRPDTSTDILPEMNFLISLHPDVTDGLVGYWPLDGNTTNFGSSGSVADGILQGTPLPALCADRRGNPGAAFCFDNANLNYIQIPYNPQLDFEYNQDFAISLWVNVPPTAPATNPLVIKATSPASAYALTEYNATGVTGTRVDSTSNTSYVTSSTFAPEDGVYRHYIFMKSGSRLYLYINNALNSSGPDLSVSSTLGSTDTNLGFLAGSYATAAFDEVRIYNRALSDREIEILYDY